MKVVGVDVKSNYQSKDTVFSIAFIDGRDVEYKEYTKRGLIRYIKKKNYSILHNIYKITCNFHEPKHVLRLTARVFVKSASGGFSEASQTRYYLKLRYFINFLFVLSSLLHLIYFLRHNPLQYFPTSIYNLLMNFLLILF